MSLKTEVFGLLDNTQRLCKACTEAKALSESLTELRERLETPLRVAVVGIMKAGKSTFMNALMGTDLLCTGNLETTYTVCWFRYGEHPKLTVCFRNGEELEAPLSELERWSARASGTENERLDDVKYLVISYPSEVLRTMEFIDTPGLDSIYGTDAQNTLDFLSIKGSEDTLYEAGKADAIIYAFSHTARAFDEKILREFHKGGTASVSPINSVGILTKADASGIWDIFGMDGAVKAARPVADTIMKNAGMRQLLFTVLPVCAKVCEGFAQLAAADWETLHKIAASDPEGLPDLLCDAKQFSSCEDEEFMALGDAAARKRLIDLIGQYGITEISALLRAGKTPEETGPELQEICGVRAVRELLTRHFGTRTFLIKTQYIFGRLRTLSRTIRKNPKSSAQLCGICEQLEEGIDDLMTSVQTLKELKALQMYYSGALQFSDPEEEQDFLRITGEYGRTVETRLGVEGVCSVAELARLTQQKVAAWHGKAGRWMISRPYVEAAAVAARSYEEMYYHLNALSEE